MGEYLSEFLEEVRADIYYETEDKPVDTDEVYLIVERAVKNHYDSMHQMAQDDVCDYLYVRMLDHDIDEALPKEEFDKEYARIYDKLKMERSQAIVFPK